MADETPHDRRVYEQFASRFTPLTYRGQRNPDDVRDVWREGEARGARPDYDPGRNVREFRSHVREDLRMARGNVRPRRNGRR